MQKAEFRARVDRIAHKMLDIADAIFETIERRHAPAPAGPLARAEAAPWRWTNDQFAFWKLCANRRCRRARCCRGEPRACLDRHLPQVPQKARDRVRLMLRARAPRARRAGAAAPHNFTDRLREIVLTSSG
jgi:hypothetical protein